MSNQGWNMKAKHAAPTRLDDISIAVFYKHTTPNGVTDISGSSDLSGEDKI